MRFWDTTIRFQLVKLDVNIPFFSIPYHGTNVSNILARYARPIW